MEKYFALLAIVHTHIVKALVTATYPYPLAKIAASQTRSTLLARIKDKVALVAAIEWSIKI
jgi:hypothetical protein